MRGLSAALVLLSLVALPFAASAHASLEPREVVADRRAIVSLVVPAEVGPIEEVHMAPPGAFPVDFVQAPPGWSLATEKDATGRVTEAKWKAATPLPRGQFAEFRFRALAPASPGTYKWSVEEHVTRVEVSLEEEMKGHASETAMEGAHAHAAEGSVRKWEPEVAVAAQDRLDKAVADLNTTRTGLSQLQQSYSQVATANAQNLQAASSASTAAYIGIAMAVVALMVAAVPLLRKKP